MSTGQQYSKKGRRMMMGHGQAGHGAGAIHWGQYIDRFADDFVYRLWRVKTVKKKQASVFILLYTYFC